MPVGGHINKDRQTETVTDHGVPASMSRDTAQYRLGSLHGFITILFFRATSLYHSPHYTNDSRQHCNDVGLCEVNRPVSLNVGNMQKRHFGICALWTFDRRGGGHRIL